MGSLANDGDHGWFDAIDTQARLNALAPSLTFGGEFENAIGTGVLSGVSGAETTSRLSKVIALGGKRAARAAAAGRTCRSRTCAGY